MSNKKNFYKSIPSPRIQDYAIPILVIFLICELIIIFPSNPPEIIMVDEMYWLQSSYYYHLYFIENDFTNKDWKDQTAIDQPPFGKYLYGFVLDLVNNKRVTNNQGLYEWFRIDMERCKVRNPTDVKKCEYFLKEEQYEKELSINNIDGKDVHLGRIITFTFLAGIIIALNAISLFFLKNKPIGVIASLFFINNTVTLKTIIPTTVDTFCYFISTMTIITLIILLQNMEKNNQKKIITKSIALGLLLSIALSTKLVTAYNAVTITLVYLIIIILKIYDKKNPMKQLVSLSIVILTSITLFIALNPALHTDTFETIQKTIILRQEAIEFHANFVPNTIRNPSQRIDAIISKGILLDTTKENIILLLFILISLLYGVRRLLKNTQEEISHRNIGPYTIILLWSISAYTVNGYFVPVAFARYFMGMVLCTSIILAIGLNDIALKIHEKKNPSP